MTAVALLVALLFVNAGLVLLANHGQAIGSVLALLIALVVLAVGRRL
jgi:hypothetical protein